MLQRLATLIRTVSISITLPFLRNWLASENDYGDYGSDCKRLDLKTLRYELLRSVWLVLDWESDARQFQTSRCQP